MFQLISTNKQSPLAPTHWTHKKVGGVIMTWC